MHNFDETFLSTIGNVNASKDDLKIHNGRKIVIKRNNERFKKKIG